MSDEAQTLQTQLAALLALSADLAGVTILTERIKNVEAEIAKALGTVTAVGGKCGICVIVVTPAAKATKPNIPGPYFDRCTIVARVIENVVINTGSLGTQTPAWTAARAVAKALHQKFTGDKKVILIDEIRLVADETNLIYDVIGTTELGLA